MRPYGESGLSSSPLREPPLVQSSPGSTSTPQNPTSPHIHAPYLSRSQIYPVGYPHLQPGAHHRPPNLNLSRPGNGHLSINGVKSEPLSKLSNGSFNSAPHDKDGTARQPPIRKDPPKPVWVDVSVLPRIPKIKRDGGSKSSGSSSALPVPSGMSLAGNSGRKQTVDNRGTGTSQQNSTLDVQKQTVDSTGASSSSFSSSFTSTTSSHSASSNSRPSSSSISFRINSSGNPWQARRLLASGGALFGDDEEAIKINNKSKRIQLSLRTKVKEEKCEVYDPFNPTGSDSSDNEPEVESQMAVGVCQDICNQIKIEPVDMDPDRESGSKICVEVKTSTCKPCQQSPHYSDTMNIPVSSGTSVSFTKCEAILEPTSCDTLGSPFLNTQECTRSLCTDRNGKSELNFKIEAEPIPIRSQSKSLEESLSNLQQTSQCNLVCKELASVSGTLNAPNISVDREEKPHQSQNKDNKQSTSNCQSFPFKDCYKTKQSRSKEKRRSHSRDRRRSRSKSKERQRSRSKERKHLHSRDKRRSSSSSRERRTNGKKAICERSNNRGRERRRKRSKERRYSRSRSFSRSRSRERKSTSKCLGDTGLKRQKSELRSTSRERKKREDQLDISLYREKSYQESTETMSIELHETAVGANKSTESVKMERDTRVCDREIMFKPSIKELEPRSVNIKSKHGDWSRIFKDEEDGISLELLKSREIKQEELWPISAVSELTDIKKEDELHFSLCKESDGVKEMKKEIVSVGLISKELPYFNKSKLNSPDLEKGYAGFQDEIKMQEMIIGKEKIKTELIWPDEYESPSSDNPLVISLDIHDVDALNSKKEPTESYHLLPLEEDKMSPLQPPDLPIKQEPAISSDEDISVDYLIDNLDFIKKEIGETFMPDSTETTDPKFSIPETSAGNTQITETVTAVLKSKSQGKRVTWNLEEPVEPQSEKLSSEYCFDFTHIVLLSIHI